MFASAHFIVLLWTKISQMSVDLIDRDFARIL